MPKYRVLKTVEHNGRIYMPAGSTAKKAVSLSDGQQKPVDATGVFETADEIDPRIIGDPDQYDKWQAAGQGTSFPAHLVPMVEKPEKPQGKKQKTAEATD